MPSLKLITSQDFEKFALFIKSDEKESCPEEFKELLYFYTSLKDFTKMYGTRITDMVSTGKRFRSVLPAISDDDYNKIIRDLTSYELCMNSQDWPDFQTPDEIRKRQILEIRKTIYSDTERGHFNEEFYLLQDQALDIVGEVNYNLMPLEEIRKFKKGKKRA